MQINIILALLAVCVIPLFIVLALPRDRKFFDKPLVKGFGLGVYTALIFMLMREGIEHGGTLSTLLWTTIGLVISLLIGFFFKEFHHHHEDHEESKHHTHASTWRILISDFFHNIVDGIAIISGFALSPVIGVTSLVGVLGHQIIQQGGQQVLLVESGLKPKKSIFISLLISLSIFLGLVLANYEFLEAPLITLSAGIIIWKIGTDILHTKWSSKTVLGFFIGILLLTGSLILMPHSH